MDERTPVPIPGAEAIAAVPASPNPSLASPPRRRGLGGWAVFVLGSAWAVPRRLLRRPGRTLAVAGLLVLIAAGVGVAGAYLWASSHLRQARTLLEQYHTAEALPHLRDALTIWPRDPESLLLAARGARRLGTFESAEDYLNRYQEVRGNDDPDLALERVLLRLERGEVDSVSKYCQSLVERDDPATPLILEALAKGCLRMFRSQQAETFLKEWLKRQPDNPQALLIQAQVYELMGRQHDAIASYRAALKADPHFEEARMRLCNSLMALGLSAEAREQLEYLHRRFPDNLMVRVLLARVYDRAGETDAADQLIEATLARQPHFAPALAERGRICLRDGQTAEAEKALREVVEREPGDYQSRYQLILCLEKLGKAEEAQKEQARLQEIDDDLKRIQEISTVKMQQNPHDPGLRYEAGAIALRAGSIGEALRWFDSALREDPHHVPTHKALMEHYRRVGDYARAREHRQKAGLSETDAAATTKGEGKRP